MAKKKSNPLDMTRQLVKKALGDSDFEVNLDLSRLKKPLPHIPTGSLAIDHLIGGPPNEYGVVPCPGIPRGKITQIWGHESAGKSTLALTIAASVHHNEGTVCYIDWEHAVDMYYAASLGVDVFNQDKFLLAQPNTMEQGLVIALAAAASGTDLIVFDSVGAAVPEKVANRGLKDVGEREQVGGVALLWSNFLRRLQATCAKSQSAVIGISQVRASINTYYSYGNNETVQGGNAWKFWSSVRISLRRVKTEKAKVSSFFDKKKMEDQVIGGRIKAKLVKCKVAPTQGHETEFLIRHGEGIDDVLTAMEIAMGQGLIKKSGSWLVWENPGGEPVRVRGVEAFRKKIISEGLIQNLYAQVRPYLSVNRGDDFEPDNEEEEFVDPNFAESGDGDISDDLRGIIRAPGLDDDDEEDED